MNEHEKINYVEFSTRNITETKKFFTLLFGWAFEDYGPEYSAFSGEGLDGGFFQSDKFSSTNNGAALIIFFSDNLEETLTKVQHFGGDIIRDIFSFPGGRRFHFKEPGGNEFAVWSDVGA